MIARLAIATVGAFVITVGILLMMSDFAERLRERDPMRYFRITDFIPADTRGLPEPPPAPALPPSRPSAQFERRPGPRIEAPRPDVERPVDIEQPVVEPTLDPSIVTPDDEAP